MKRSPVRGLELRHRRPPDAIVRAAIRGPKRPLVELRVRPHSGMQRYTRPPKTIRLE